MGGCVGFYSGDIKKLPEDMKALRPTIMPAVPRLLNRIYDKVSDYWDTLGFYCCHSEQKKFSKKLYIEITLFAIIKSRATDNLFILNF